MPKFKVKGIALVPAEVEMTVTATTNVEALSLARAAFKDSMSRAQFVVGNSHDDNAVSEWEPYEAEPVA